MKQDGFYATGQNYNLPVTDTDKERRNFPSYKENTYFTLEDIIAGDSEGTTDTDSKTDTYTGERRKGYTRINQKHG